MPTLRESILELAVKHEDREQLALAVATLALRHAGDHALRNSVSKVGHDINVMADELAGPFAPVSAP